LSWIAAQAIGTALIEPGKPWQNGVAESFNGKFRDECLSLEWFRTRAEAKVVIESWRRHFKAVRPRSSLGYLTERVCSSANKKPAPREATRPHRANAADGAPSQASRGPKNLGRSGCPAPPNSQS
jgi:putative transposase